MTLQQTRNKLMVKINFQKTTSSGHTWSMTENGWLDESSGLVWKCEDEEGTYTYDDAIAKFGESLPTKEEWELAEKHGVREVLSLDRKFYWSASVHSFSRSNAWFFYSLYGNVLIAYRFITYSVRLIVR